MARPSVLYNHHRSQCPNLNMSSANTANNKSGSTPWKDWKVDTDFLSELNKYCAKRKTPLTKLVDEFIVRVKAGINVAVNVLVSQPYCCGSELIYIPGFSLILLPR